MAGFYRFFSSISFSLFPLTALLFSSSQPFFVFPSVWLRWIDENKKNEINKWSASHCRERKRLEIESKEASNHKMEIPRHVLRNQKQKKRSSRVETIDQLIIDQKWSMTKHTEHFPPTNSKKKTSTQKSKRWRRQRIRCTKRETRNVIYSQKKKRKMSVYKFREREAGKRRRRVKFIAAGILMKWWAIICFFSSAQPAGSHTHTHTHN